MNLEERRYQDKLMEMQKDQESVEFERDGGYQIGVDFFTNTPRYRRYDSQRTVALSPSMTLISEPRDQMVSALNSAVESLQEDEDRELSAVANHLGNLLAGDSE